LENKSVLVEDFGDKAKAMEIIAEALRFYVETFGGSK
jgi:inorganic pyrophosphatase